MYTLVFQSSELHEGRIVELTSRMQYLISVNNLFVLEVILFCNNFKFFVHRASLFLGHVA